MGAVVFPAPSTSVASGSQTFNSSSTWTAPSGVTKVNYIVAGAGGGGGAGCNPTTNSNYNFGSSGGAGGEVLRGSLTVTPGTTYPITVGAGGAGGVTTSTAITTTAAVGGYSTVALNFSLENALTNGALEFGQDGLWWASYSGSYGFPYYDSAYPSGYSQQPSTNYFGQTNRTGGTVITNVSSATGVKKIAHSPNGSIYADIQRFVPVTAGTQYVLSAWVSAHDGSGQSPQVGMAIDYFTSAGAVGRVGGDQTSFGAVSSSESVWTRLTLNTTAPSGANFAVLRFARNNEWKAAWTGMQLESGTSVTDYMGPNVSGAKTVEGLGIISVNSGVIASGGGGGSSAQASSEVKGSGFGGGAFMSQSGTFVMGGNGSGQGGALNNITLLASSTTLPYLNGVYTTNNGNGGIPSGGAAYVTGGTGYMFQQNGAPSTSEGLGAGGMGSRGGNIIAGLPSIGAGAGVVAGNSGNSGSANTGAGGGAGMAASTGAATGFNGGNGGSGKVILSW